MGKSEWFEKASQSILDTDDEAARKIAEQSLEAGMDPLEMINAGFYKNFWITIFWQVRGYYPVKLRV